MARTIELARIVTGKSTRGALIWHEQYISKEPYIADPVGRIGRGAIRRVQAIAEEGSAFRIRIIPHIRSPVRPIVFAHRWR